MLDTQNESRTAIRAWAADLRLFTDMLVEMDPDLRSIVVNAPDAGAALQTWSRTTVRASAHWCPTWTS